MTASGACGAIMIKNERGVMFLSAVFLTLIISFIAVLTLNAKYKVQQRNSTLYFTAINLANEQFAILESSILEGESNLRIDPDEMKSYNGMKENAAPIEFRVTKIPRGANEYTVKVEWTVNGETETFESTKIILPKKLEEVQP